MESSEIDAEPVPKKISKGALQDMASYVEDLILKRWPGSRRQFVVTAIRTRGGVVVRVFPEFKKQPGA